MKIAIINPGGVTNLGERAIMQGTIYYLKEKHPSAHIRIFGYKVIKNEDAPLYDEISGENITFTDNITQGDGIVSRSLHMLKLLFLPSLALDKEDFKYLKECDVVISKGQETLTESYGFVHFIDSIIEQYAVARINPNIELLGHSIGPIHRYKIIAKHVLKKIRYIHVRDSKSFDVLKNIDYPQAQIEQRKDLAYLAIEKYSKLMKIEKKDQHYLIVPNTALMKGDTSRDTYLKTIEQTIEACLATDRGVIIGSSVTATDWNNDYVICDMMKKKYPEITLKYYKTLYDFLVDVRTAHVVISSRLHPLIMSNAQKIRLFAISNSHKVEGLLGDAGLSDFIASPSKPLDKEKLEKLLNL